MKTTSTCSRQTTPLLLLFLLLQTISLSQQQTLSSTEDLVGLYALRASLGVRAANWPRKTDPCTGWTGVACDPTGRVVSLNLSALKRTRLGKLNPRFAVDGLRNLTRLVSFNSSRFSLPGPIPDWFGSGLSVFVSAIDLSRSSVKGRIPSGIGEMRNLTVLDLSGNRLVGSVADGVGKLSRLEVLNLGGNSLSGAVPGKLFVGLVRLRSLVLANNDFSGPLPGSVWGLSELRFVDVSYNRFSGSLMDSIGNVSANGAVFNFSNNLFYGRLPVGFGEFVRKSRIVDVSTNYLEGGAEFDGNGSVSIGFNCFRNVSRQRSLEDCSKFYSQRGMSFEGFEKKPEGPSESSGRKSKRRLVYILVGMFGGLFVVVTLVMFVLCLMKCRTRCRQSKEAGPNSISSVGQLPPSTMSVNLPGVGDSFTYDNLLQATSNFSDSNLIKHGHSGDLYYGTLERGTLVVVKRINALVFRREFCAAELDFYVRASHTRLVSLLGHSLENESEKLLVYKYMPNRDLSSALYRKPVQDEDGLQSLDWITRLKIATGVAEALSYLHHECRPPFVHRDVQASSILLDDKFEVRLGSLSEVCTQDGDSHQNVISKFLRLSQSSDQQAAPGSPPATCSYDVYCMGKVLLELVTGKLGISGSNEASTNAWVEQTLSCISIHEKELLVKILDPSLILDEDLMEEVWAMAIVAKSCLNPKPSKRPQIKHVLKALENPLKVVRRENDSYSAQLRTTSSRGSWDAALFGSWRSSSEIVSFSRINKDDAELKRSGTIRSRGSGGELPFSYKRQSKEIFPEPSGISSDEL